MSLDEMLGAIRAADGGADDGADHDADLASATRLRVMRSLETRARSRHQLVGVATTLAILFAGTVSWALATGQVAALWRPSPEVSSPEPRVVAPPPPHAPLRRPHAVVAARRADQPPEPLPPEAPPAPVPVTPAPAPAMPAPAPAMPAPAPAAVLHPTPPSPLPAALTAPPVVPAPVIEALYRRAHDLHFHGGDPAAALAAWDGYLAAEPHGRFSVEARYNRALLLVRLGRYAEARAALVPFARGAVVPAGYRQAEAEQLVERLARYEGSP